MTIPCGVNHFHYCPFEAREQDPLCVHHGQISKLSETTRIRADRQIARRHLRVLREAGAFIPERWQDFRFQRLPQPR